MEFHEKLGLGFYGSSLFRHIFVKTSVGSVKHELSHNKMHRFKKQANFQFQRLYFFFKQVRLIKMRL